MMKSFSESCYGDLSIDWLNLFSELVTNTKIAKQFLRFGGLRIILSMLRIKHLNIVFQVLRILKDLQNHGLLKTVEFKNSSRQQLIKYLGEETLIKPIVKEVQETVPVSIPKPITIKSIIKKQVVKIFDEVPFRDVKPTYDHSTDNSNLNNKPMFKTMTHLDRTESLYLDENYRDIKSESKTKRPSSGRKKHTNERAIKVIDLDEKDTLDQSTTKLDTKELISKSSNPSKSPMIPKTDKKNSGTKPITKPTKISNSNLFVAKKSSPVNSKSNINSVPKMRKSIVGIAPLKVPTVVEIKSQQKFEEIIPETTQSDLESEKIYSLIDNARSFDSNIRLNALVALQRMLSLEVPVQICDDICKVILERFNDDDTKISILCCEIIYHMVMLESLHDTLIDTGIIDQLVMNLSGYNLSVIEYSLWVLDRFCSNGTGLILILIDVRIKQLYQLNATQSLAVMVHSGIENIRLHSQSILRKMAVIDDKSIRDAVEIILQNNPWATVSKTWIDFHPWTPFPISNGELKKLAITK
ncbi:hypothetical protein HDV02_004575 [Globomyces sp. JEL0801]|nr:hypothetical protein HDV02_004575 [Globomyces sp. JEL0801]